MTTTNYRQQVNEKFQAIGKAEREYCQLVYNLVKEAGQPLKVEGDCADEDEEAGYPRGHRMLVINQDCDEMQEVVFDRIYIKDDSLTVHSSYFDGDTCDYEWNCNQFFTAEFTNIAQNIVWPGE